MGVPLRVRLLNLWRCVLHKPEDHEGATQDGEQWPDWDSWVQKDLLSVRWVKIDAMAQRYQISVMEDEMSPSYQDVVVYIAFKRYMGRNIYCTHVDPAEASLGVLKEMVRIEARQNGADLRS